MVAALRICTFLAVAVASQVVWGAECAGTVRGLSGVYDPRTGSGFLAVRAGPAASARQDGELFNGDRVSIFDRRGNWYRLYAPGIGEGWASSRWIANSCGY